MRQKINILLIIGQLDQGGAERQLFLFLSELREPATVLSLSKGGYWASRIRQLGYEVIELERKGHLEFSRLLATIKILREKKPSVVHLFCDGVGGLYVRIAALITNHACLVVGFRCMPSFYPAWFRYLLTALNRGVSAVVCNSWAAVDYLKEHNLVKKDTVYYIPNFFDPASFQTEAEDFSLETKKSEEELIVGTIASLSHRKNPFLFIQAAAKIQKVKPKVRFWMIGDGRLRKRCELLIRDLGLQGVVKLLGIQENISRFLSELDVFALTSRYEGTPNAFLEAMAARLPCVVTDVGDAGRIAVASGAGLVVDSEDLQGIVQAILKLLNDSDLRLKMGQAGYSYILRTYTKSDVAQRYVGLYKKLLSPAIT